MINVDLLTAAITRSGLKKKYIASKLGLSAYGFSLKAKGEREFTASEIKLLCEILGITRVAERDSIFFA